MKRTICTIFICLFFYKGFNQISFEFDTLKLDEIITKVKPNCKNVFYEGLFAGPSADFFITIQNSTNDFIKIKYNDINIEFIYLYKDSIYNFALFFPLNLYDEEYLVLSPNERKQFVFSSVELLDYRLRGNKNTLNYLSTIVYILPEIKCIFEFNNRKFMEKPKKIIIKTTSYSECFIYNYKRNKILRKLNLNNH